MKIFNDNTENIFFLKYNLSISGLRPQTMKNRKSIFKMLVFDFSSHFIFSVLRTGKKSARKYKSSPRETSQSCLKLLKE